ncbi:MAG: hypothetical protein ABR502_08655, partial [Chitinophagaceae bacterium]
IVDLFALEWLVNRYNIIEELKQLEQELAKTLDLKKQLADQDQFEEAAYNRDKARILQKKIDKLKKQLKPRK